ncbi:MAG: hypothetical protein AMXMBFR61_01570 [Fimbriimonadales bacterium]
MRRQHTGLTLIELMVVVLIIGILLVVAVPNYVRARTKSQTTVCLRNLAKIDMAKEHWAMANKASNGATVTMDDLVSDFLKAAPVCPAGGDYDPRPVGTAPTCSIGGEHSLP